MSLSGYFLLLYGIARTGIEFIRLPDAHIGYLMNTDWLTKGIVLSAPMIIAGFALVIYSQREKPNAAVS